MPELGERLKRLLKESGLSPHAAATAAGIDPSNLYRLLGGERRRPSNDTLTRLARVLGVQVDELTGAAEATVQANAAAQRLARFATELGAIDLEEHLRTLASLSPAGQADCVAYTRWRAQREQMEPALSPRKFTIETPEPKEARVLGETSTGQAAMRNAS